MHPNQLKQLVKTAIEEDELRKAIRVMDNIREAHETLSYLSIPTLEALRDELHAMALDRTGPRKALKVAWCKYAEQMLKDAHRRQREGPFGLYEDDAEPGGE
jgi:hypothetical protein